MDKIFLDTNVLLDHLAARMPFDRAAKTLFDRAEKGQIELFASALSFVNIAYILRKVSPGADIPEILKNLALLVSTTPVDGAVISDALDSGMKDFEDAVQLFSAIRFGGIDGLITRNVADFSNKLLAIETPESYLLGHP